MLSEIKIISVNTIYYFILKFRYFFIYFKISIAKSGTLEFKHGERSKTLPITIIDGILVYSNSILKIFAKIKKIFFFLDKTAEKDESFAIEIFDPKGGVKLGRVTKTVVTIINDDGN